MKKSALLLIVLFVAITVHSQELTVRDIMRDPSIAGMRPDSEKLSPDGKFVVYAWNADGIEPRNLYLSSTNGMVKRILVNAAENYERRSGPPESKLNYGLTVRDDFVKAREMNLGGVEFSPDSKKILFLQNTDIYTLDVADSNAKPRRITRTQGPESGARWLTNDSLLYSSGGNWFVLNLVETSLVQVTKEGNPANFVTVFNANASKDGKLLAYVLSDGSKQRALFTPNYLGEFVQTPSSRRGFTEQKVLVSPTDGSREKPFEINLPKAEGAAYFRSLKWAADNRSLVIDRVDKDTKRRQLFFVHNVGSKDERIILVTEETDDKWQATLSSIVEPNPHDASEIAFGSERDGFNHIYFAKLEKASPEPNPTGEIRQENPSDAGFTGKVETKQLTNGSWEVEWTKWLNADAIVFSSTRLGTAERQFGSISKSGGQITEPFGRSPGMKSDPQLSEGGNVLIFESSTWNSPGEMKSININAGSQSLTSTIPTAFLKRSWIEPKFIYLPSRDGKVIKSKIYLPPDYGKVKDKPAFPMVIFVHGAGYLQNVINGWNNYYREFMFNELLAKKGYIVLDIDYRGSAGYGRDWRTDVYDFLGGKDFDDHIDAIDFMIKNYSVDPKNVGAYGGSYGGFMAAMLVLRAPERIAAAAALRPVFDWKNYFYSSPIYTAQRLGFPDRNPEAYKRSSPITYAENLQKPLLILHGLVDDNVPAQDSIQMIEKLMRLEKTRYFDAMLYPSENHGFQRPTSWADEYERILAFFERNLKN